MRSIPVFVRAGAAALALVLGNAPALNAGELVLAAEGRAPWPVVTEKRHEKAARQLADYLKRISGADFPVVVTNAVPAGPAILVGRFDGPEPAGLKGDSWWVDAAGERLQIDGATAAGVSFGVFAFLEEQLGCRWWAWDEEAVPSNSTIRIPEGRHVQKAVFTQTIMMNREAESPRNAFEYKTRVKNAEAWSGGHTIYALLTPYAKDHPGIYPLDRKTGQRAGNALHFCYSAPGIAEALADALEAEVKKRNGNVRDVIYMAGMGDWYGGACECERCEAIYLEEGYTATNGIRKGIIGGTNLRMINRTAEILESRCPGVKVGTMAYMSMEAPPTLTRPRTNVYIRIPHLRHCIIHTLAECSKNAGYLANLEKWCELAPDRVHVWDYGVNFGDNFMYPFPVITSIGKNIRLYEKLKLAGLIVQGNYVSTGSDLVVLKNYVWRKLLWDPSLDIGAVVREFCDGYYGPAAAPLFAYVMDLEKAVAPGGTNVAHMDEFGERTAMRKLYLTPEREARLRALAQEARQKAAGAEPYARRVEEAVVSLDAFDLWHPGPFAEADGKLVRADMDNAYTYDRALAVCKNSRQSGAREWNTCRAYQEPFLAMQGGPLAVLKAGDVEATLAPAQAMRIRQIRFRGKPLLAVPDDPREKGWPNLGGCALNARPGWTTGQLAGSPTATGAVMTAGAGPGPTPTLTVVQETGMGPDGSIRITLTSERLSRDPISATNRCSHAMSYQIEEGAGFTVEALTSNGWQTVLTPEQAKSAAVAAATNGAAANPADKGGKAAKPEPVPFALPKDLTALRVTLPGAGCVVEDRFPAPRIQGGSVSFDRPSGVLKTSAETMPVTLPPKGATLWLERVIAVAPCGELRRP